METKPILKKLSVLLWILAGILLAMIIISWFVDYPKWLSQLISNILMVGLGIVMFYKAYQIRNRDRQFSIIYLIIGAALIVVALFSFTFVKIVAVIGLAFFLLTNQKVRNIINKKEENHS